MRSLRRRVRLWIIATTTAIVTLGSAVGMVDERRQLAGAEAAYVGGFLEHLAAMPDFRKNSASARAHLQTLAASFARAGGKVALVPLARPPELSLGSGAVACQPLSLSDGNWALHYWSDGRFIKSQLRRGLAIRVGLGATTIFVLLAGLEWILRRNLFAPLDTISRQIERITEGGGWIASVPRSDAELSRLTAALRALGPGLEMQTRRWIDLERRCAAAAVLSGLRRAVLDPLRDVHLELSQLEAGPYGDATTKRRLRRAARGVEQLSAALNEADERWFPSQSAEHPPGAADAACPRKTASEVEVAQSIQMRRRIQ